MDIVFQSIEADYKYFYLLLFVDDWNSCQQHSFLTLSNIVDHKSRY